MSTFRGQDPAFERENDALLAKNVSGMVFIFIRHEFSRKKSNSYGSEYYTQNIRTTVKGNDWFPIYLPTYETLAFLFTDDEAKSEGRTHIPKTRQRRIKLDKSKTTSRSTTRINISATNPPQINTTFLMFNVPSSQTIDIQECLLCDSQCSVSGCVWSGANEC